MKFSKLIILPLFIMISSQAFGQSYSCQTAMNSLKSYANSVNYQYSYGMNWINSTVHPAHRQGYFQSLNAWYYQQSLYVSQNYYTLSAQCHISQPSNHPEPDNNGGGWHLDGRIPDSDQQARVRIKIPETAAGWQHD